MVDSVGEKTALIHIPAVHITMLVCLDTMQTHYSSHQQDNLIPKYMEYTNQLANYWYHSTQLSFSERVI